MPRTPNSSRRSDHKGAQRWPLIEELLSLGFSMDQVSLACGFSKGSIQNDLSDHGGTVSSLFPDRPRDHGVRYRQAFERYVELESVIGWREQNAQLNQAFRALLEIDRMTSFLNGMTVLINRQQRLCPEDRGDQPWCDLAHVLLGSELEIEPGWSQLIRLKMHVAAGNPAPCWPEDPEIIGAFDGDQLRSPVLPIATPDRLALLKAFVETPAEDGLSETESKVIIERNGLQRFPPFCLGERRAHSLEEVGQQFMVTRERIRQIEFKALRKLRCRHWILAPLRPYAQAAPEQRRIAQLEAEIIELRKRLMVYEPQEQFIGDSSLVTLAKRCDEMDLSIRSANCLQNAGIEYIGQLVKFTEEGVLKVKNMSRKSRNEIKEELTDLGLSFGMKLPPQVAALYPIPAQFKS